MYSSVDIRNAQKKGTIYIYPFIESNLKGASLNVTASLFALSSKKGLLIRVHEEKGNKYIDIDADDTALILTREYIKINSGSIAGTIHSKVRLVCNGLGHISATSDPWWQGSLLMAINNPTSKSKRLKIFDMESGFTSIGTIVFYSLNTETNLTHDNLPARHDILVDCVEKSSNLRKRLIFNKQFLQIDEIIAIITDGINQSFIRQDNYTQLNFTKTSLIEISYLLNLNTLKEVKQRANKLINDLTFYDYSENLQQEIILLCKFMLENSIEEKLGVINEEINRLLTLSNLEFEGLNWTYHLNNIEKKIIDYSRESSLLFWILKWVNLHNIILVTTFIALCGLIIFQVLQPNKISILTGNFITVLGTLFLVFLSLIRKK